MSSTNGARVSAAELVRFATAALAGVGLSPDDAGVAARAMVEADLRGIHSHGTALLPTYVNRIRHGGINPRPNIRLLEQRGSTAVLDGDHAMGHVSASRGMEIAMQLAERLGVGVVVVRNGNHFGAASVYSMLPLARGQIGLAACNTVVAMPPPGGSSPVVGNNPLSIAVPAGRYPPLVLDMATSVVAGYKIFLAAQRGERIPLGWALDHEGQPTDDPMAAWAGMLLPAGGVKGYGLAIALEALCGMLSGALFGADVGSIERFAQPERSGFFLLALAVESFMPLDLFTARVDQYVETVKAARLAPGSAEVFLPGELEHTLRQERWERGIPLEPFIWNGLAALARETGIAPARGWTV